MRLWPILLIILVVLAVLPLGRGCARKVQPVVQQPVSVVSEEPVELEQDRLFRQRVQAYQRKWGKVDTSFEESENNFEQISEEDESLFPDEGD